MPLGFKKMQTFDRLKSILGCHTSSTYESLGTVVPIGGQENNHTDSSHDTQPTLWVVAAMIHDTDAYCCYSFAMLKRRVTP